MTRTVNFKIFGSNQNTPYTNDNGPDLFSELPAMRGSLGYVNSKGAGLRQNCTKPYVTLDYTELAFSEIGWLSGWRRDFWYPVGGITTRKNTMIYTYSKTINVYRQCDTSEYYGPPMTAEPRMSGFIRRLDGIGTFGVADQKFQWKELLQPHQSLKIAIETKCTALRTHEVPVKYGDPMLFTEWDVSVTFTIEVQ